MVSATGRNTAQRGLGNLRQDHTRQRLGQYLIADRPQFELTTYEVEQNAM